MSGSITVGGKTLASHDNGTGNLSLDNNVQFPAGHVLQVVHTETSETNTLDTTYTNYYEVPLTLKSNSSDVIVSFTVQWYIVNADSGFGIQIYRKNSTGVTTSDTAVWTKNPTNPSIGPFTEYSSQNAMYGVTSITGKDVLTGLNAGDTIYYALFAKAYQSDDIITFPTDAFNTSTDEGFFSSLIMEVQK